MADLKTDTELKDSFKFEVYYATEITNIKYKNFIIIIKLFAR